MSITRRVPPVQHQLVPVRIFEERHVADACVARLTVELDADLLEPLPRSVDVRDTKRDVADVWAKRAADRCRVDQVQADVARLDLGKPGLPRGTVEAERVPVELLSPLHV